MRTLLSYLKGRRKRPGAFFSNLDSLENGAIDTRTLLVGKISSRSGDRRARSRVQNLAFFMKSSLKKERLLGGGLSDLYDNRTPHHDYEQIHR